MDKVNGNGIELAYKTVGSGKPIVLLHGNSGTHKDMELFEKELSKTHQVVTFDLRGHGLSDKGEKKYTIKLLALDILSACETLGITHCDMIGYSDGGNVLLTINTLQPNFVIKSVAVSPNYSVFGMKTMWIIILNIIYIFSSFWKIFKTSYGGLNSKMRLMVRDYKLSPSELESITSSTLIIEAEKDMIKHKHLVNLSSLIPSSELSMVKGTTHFTITKSEETIAIIKKFILYDSASIIE